MDARNPDGGGSNGEALATIKSGGLMVAWGIANDRRNNRGVQVGLANGIQHINATPCAFTTKIDFERDVDQFPANVEGENYENTKKVAYTALIKE